MAITPVYSLPYQALTDPPHGPNLGQNLAEAVEAELARIDTPAGPWTDFSAAAIVSAPTYVKGLTSYSARYQRNGKVVNYAFTITINTGGGFAPGAGPYSFLLPVTAQAGTLSAGSVWVNDSGTALRVGSLILANTTNAQAYLYNLPGNALDSNGPGTAWATGDAIRGFITYEAA